MTHAMNRRLTTLFIVTLAGCPSSGCVYYNGIYNAQSTLQQAEAARAEGRDLEAQASYAEAVEIAARSFRKEPEGPWADDALYIMGRAWFRAGDLTRAVPALRQALARAEEPGVRRGAALFLGAALAQLGDDDAALDLLNQAMRGLRDDPLLADGHFWRGQVHFARDEWELGFWDLARAAEADSRLRLPASFERLRFGAGRGDTLTVQRELELLFSSSEGSRYADGLLALGLDPASSREPTSVFSDPHFTLEALGAIRQAAWPPGPRARIALARGRLAAQIGDSAQAWSDVLWVAEGSSPAAVEARAQLARWQLTTVSSVSELEAVRELLRPAAGMPEIVDLVRSLRRVEVLANLASQQDGERLAGFAAAETARDELGALRLARALFVSYIESAPEGAADAAWVGKALLAILATTPQPAGDPQLREQLASRMSDPYVATARTGRVGAARVEQLEAELAGRLAALRSWAEGEVHRWDLALRGENPDASASPNPTPRTRQP